MHNQVQELFETWHSKEDSFSGVFSVREKNKVILDAASGCRNMAEGLGNTEDTKFGTASGTKLFTAIAVCMLAEQGKLGLDDRILDILELDFPLFSPEITVKQVLTHTAGIPDYFDEDETDDFEAIWGDRPVYKITELEHFLPLFQNLPMKSQPGQHYSYSNSGYIMLGLLIEHISHLRYQEFIQKNIIEPCNLNNTGFFRMDMLPENTALGYLFDPDLQGWRTNIYSIPVIGGSDGGMFTNAGDMQKFWTALATNQILGSDMTSEVFYPQVQITEDRAYGYGVYLRQSDGVVGSCYVVGMDPGVNFFSVYYPNRKIIATAFSNTEVNIFPLLKELYTVVNG